MSEHREERMRIKAMVVIFTELIMVVMRKTLEFTKCHS